jgi:gliding motility-associated lipoprotein GldH
MKKLALISSLCGLIWLACSPPKLETYEKNRDIPQHLWDTSYQPHFDLRIGPEDTSWNYDIYVQVRHRDAYAYSNLWVLVETTRPQDSLTQTRRIELPLADSYGNWLGSGLNDIFEHRIPIQEQALFSDTGIYQFRIIPNMRQNPLPDIMSVGMRIEKTTQR